MLNLGKLGLDVIVNGKGLDELNDKIRGTSSNLNGLGGIGKKVAKALSFTAITAGIYKLGKACVSAYADFQQLEGGVETLFGSAATKVMKDAQKAYAEAGLSANEYMEQATSFSASLIQSLGGDQAKAAEVANMAIIDMSDNANKMGTSMEMIQNAYQGFAKQNFTMLDNLKLGYGGTKTEMERLLSDAEKLTGKKYDISNLNDIYQAIHAIQGELGITGTTAEEAKKTISGSFNAMKAAWSDMLTIIANPESTDADIEKAAQNFTETLTILLENVVPVIIDLLPDIIDAAADIIDALCVELNKEENKEKISKSLKSLVGQSLATAFEDFPILTTIIGTYFTAKLAAGIGTAFKSLPTSEAAPPVQGAGNALGVSFARALLNPITIAGGMIVAILGTAIKEGGGWDVFMESIQTSWDDTKKSLSNGWDNFIENCNHAKKVLGDTFSKNLKPVTDTAKNLIEGVRTKIDELKNNEIIIKATDHVSTVVNSIKSKLAGLTGKNYSVNVNVNSSDSFSASGGLDGDYDRDGKITWHKKKINGTHRYRIGANEIPADNWPAMLHQGEMVLTAAEANQYQKYLQGMETGGNSTVFNITGNTFRNRDDIDYLCTEIQKKISRQLAR